MRFLLTGVSGMLGANLCRMLVQQGHQVNALVRRPPLTHPLLNDLALQVFQGDITDQESVLHAARDCDGLFHVAGFISYLPRDRTECFRINVTGTKTVLTAASLAGIPRAIVTSSTAAIGIPLDGRPLDEQSAFDRRFVANPYMESKRQAELMALACKEIEVVAVNPSTILGAGDVKMNTGVMFRQLQQERLSWLPPGGLGLVSVGDCVQGHWAAWQKGEPGQRYILSAHNCPLAEVFASIAKTLGVRCPDRVLPGAIFPAAYASAWLHDMTLGRLGIGQFSRFMVEIGFRNRFFDSSRAQRELAWRPAVSLAQMISDAADFYQEHGLLGQST